MSNSIIDNNDLVRSAIRFVDLESEETGIHLDVYEVIKTLQEIKKGVELIGDNFYELLELNDEDFYHQVARWEGN